MAQQTRYDRKALSSNQVETRRTHTNWRRQVIMLAFSAWTAVLLSYFLSLLVFTVRNDDQSWYLYAAKRLLHGATLYGPQLVETNPPLILWFSAIPVFLAHLFHLDSYLMLKLTVFAMIGASTAWSARILRKAGAAEQPVLFYMFWSAVVAGEIFVTWFQVGQREHLLLILILPYVLAAIYESRCRLCRFELCVMGAAAGIALCFKPQQVLILIALELFLAAWTRSLRRLIRPGFICAILAVSVYIGFVELCAPLYFSTTIPLLRDTYWAYGPASTWSLIKSEPYFDFAFIAALIAMVWKRNHLAFPAAPGALLACAAGASIGFYVQHIGATEAAACRAYPQYAFLLLAVAWFAIDLIASSFGERMKLDSMFIVATLFFALILAPPLMSLGHLFAHFELRVKRFPDSVLAQYPAGTPVYFMATSPWEFPAVLKDHLVWASRSPCLWMLPAIVQNEMSHDGGPVAGKILAAPIIGRLAALQRTEATEDIENWKPRVILVRQCHKWDPCQGLPGREFDPLAWFLRNPGFAFEWTHYRLQQSRDNFDVYTRTH